MIYIPERDIGMRPGLNTDDKVTVMWAKKIVILIDDTGIDCHYFPYRRVLIDGRILFCNKLFISDTSYFTEIK